MAKIIVELEIDGDPADAYHVVDSLLDGGVFQDAINEHDFDAGELRVTRATVKPRCRRPKGGQS